MQPLVPIRIIKLGGSLLELPDLRSRFHSWIESQTPARNLIVAGGGQAVEAIRELDAIHHFASEFSHWLCVDLMSFTAKLVSELLGDQQIVSTPADLIAFQNQQFEESLKVACVQPTAYYTPLIAKQQDCSLPESWDCTSDSIAAWLASSIGATDLVLLKSIETEFAADCDLSSESIRLLAERGVVDRVFPSACQQVRCIRIINLRVA